MAADDAEDEGAVVEPGASLPVSYCGILKRDGGFTSDDPDERIRQFARVVRATVIVPEHQVISEEEEGEGSEGEGEDLGGAAADERDAAMGRAADAAEEEEEDEGDEPQPTLVETDIIFGGEGPSFRLLLSQPDSSEVEAGGGGRRPTATMRAERGREEEQGEEEPRRRALPAGRSVHVERHPDPINEFGRNDDVMHMNHPSLFPLGVGITEKGTLKFSTVMHLLEHYNGGSDSA